MQKCTLCSDPCGFHPQLDSLRSFHAILCVICSSSPCQLFSFCGNVCLYGFIQVMDKNVEQHIAKGRPQWHSTPEGFADRCQSNMNTLGANLQL